MPRKPLLGNWFEEEAYERDRVRLMQGRHGNLLDARTEVANIAAKVQHHNTPVDLTPFPPDGYLRFYKPVMLQNAGTLGYLGVDLDDHSKTSTGWQVACSTAAVSEATYRCTFLLVPAPTPPTDSYVIPADEVDMVHYGQPFYIMTLKEFSPDPLSLMSEFKSFSSASKVSGKHQNVCFTPDGGSAACMWCADYANPEYAEDMRDHPIKAEDILVLRHNMTSAPLASVKESFYNDFGEQYEVCAGRILAYASKRQAAPMADENYWMFIHSGQGASNIETPATATPVAAEKNKT